MRIYLGVLLLLATAPASALTHAERPRRLKPARRASVPYRRLAQPARSQPAVQVIPVHRHKRPASALNQAAGSQTVYIRMSDGADAPSAPQTQTIYVPVHDEPAPARTVRPPFVSNYETLIAPPEAAEAPPRQTKSDVDLPAYQTKEVEDSYAVVVGVENYSGLPKAEFAAHDAEAVREHLKSLGYPVRHTMFLADDKAVRSALEKYVDSWLPKQVGAGSRVFFYFSGHGAPDPKTGQTFLMPWDGDPKYLAETGYPTQRLLAKLDALPAKQVVVALDACFSGTGGRSVLPDGIRPLVTKVDLGRASYKRLVLLTASGADEISGTDREQGHGLFTYYFLKGLNGAAHGSREGLSVQDLYDYLKPEVEDAARRDNRDQSPQLLAPPQEPRRLLIKDLR